MATIKISITSDTALDLLATLGAVSLLATNDTRVANEVRTLLKKDSGKDAAPEAPATAAAPVPVVTAPAAPVNHAPSTPALPVAAPTAPAVPLAGAPTYTLEQLGKAGADLISFAPAKMPDMMALLQQYGVQAITQLKQEHIGPFAIALKGLGAKL